MTALRVRSQTLAEERAVRLSGALERANYRNHWGVAIPYKLVWAFLHAMKRAHPWMLFSAAPEPAGPDGKTLHLIVSMPPVDVLYDRVDVELARDERRNIKVESIGMEHLARYEARVLQAIVDAEAALPEMEALKADAAKVAGALATFIDKAT